MRKAKIKLPNHLLTDPLDYGFFTWGWVQTTQSEDIQRIYKFCSAVRRNEQLDPALLDEIAARFEQVLQGTDAAEAFGTKRRRGREKSRDLDNYYLQIELAVAVLVEKRSRKSRPLALIYDHLVPLYKDQMCKASYIQDCYEKHRKKATLGLRWLDLTRNCLGAVAKEDFTNARKLITELTAFSEQYGRGFVLFNPPRNYPTKTTI